MRTRVIALSLLIPLGLFLGSALATADSSKTKGESDMKPVQNQESESKAATSKAQEDSSTAPDVFKVKFECSNGTFIVEFHKDWSPTGVQRVYDLVKSGFYDKARFFRVIEGFMAQFGMAGDPAVHAKWSSKTIQDDPVKKSNVPGMVTFAKTGMPNSRSTQLFINFGNNSFLDRQGFAPIGQVVEGMEVVNSLYSKYGEGAPSGRGPSQGTIAQQGNAYLESKFPELDYIKKASIIQ